MTNVSSEKTDDDSYKIAHKQLIDTVSRLQRRNTHDFLDGLLTESETIMLVKRFAAAVMFQKHYSTYKVSRTLGISISTAQRIYSQYKIGNFDKLLNCVTKKDKNELVSLLEDFMLSRVNYKARLRLAKRSND
ncbi:MAG: Trp family transcriptional regulator [Candidatus Pacebacteria bacterium]|nr:Trp family transcriptional regulator [Candidatus Paceibacterota bacterium]